MFKIIVNYISSLRTFVVLIHNMEQRIYFQEEERIVKKKSGWIVVETDFTQVYDCMTEIAPYINSVTTYKLMFWLLKYAVNKQNGVLASKGIYEKFNDYLKEKCDKCAITYRTFLNCMSEMRESKILTQVGKGHYYFNPHVLWRDDKKKRQEFIIDEKKDGKTISHNPNIKHLKEK